MYLLIIFCSVSFSPSIFLTLPTTGNILARPFCLRRKKQKKSPLRWRQCQRRRSFFFEKRKRRVHRPSLHETHSLGFLLDFQFSKPSTVCPCYYGVFPFSSRPRVGAAAPNPRRTRRPVGGGQCVCFFSSQGHLLSWMARTRSPLPDGRANARRAAMAEAPDRVLTQ